MTKRHAVTLVELMIAVAVISIGVAGGMGSFKYINQAISQARVKTIAANLAQEKMEVLKSKTYFQLLVTTAPDTSTGYDPNFVFDTINYPPETITLWGMPALTRSVNVDYASVSGSSVSIIPYSSNDPGMKKITVNVSWTERGTLKKYQLESYYQNDTVANLSTGFSGRVTINPGGAALAGALVQVSGTPKWRAYSNASGDYSFQVAPGTYSLVCSSVGFFTQNTDALNVVEGAYTPQNFAMIRIATGTVASNSVYTTNPSLVISQIVASTVQAGGFDAQYVELFNPTTAPIDIGVNSATNLIKLNFTSRYPGPSQTCTDIPLIYVSTFVPSGGYFLIANINAFMVNGMTLTSDAYYTDTANTSCSDTSVPGYAWTAPSAKPILMYDHSGTVWLTDSAGNTLDAAGWTSGGNTPDHCETSCITLAGGLKRNDQIVRFSTPCVAGITYGRAYDNGNNANDFYYNNTGSATGITYRPFSKTSPIQNVLAGVPAPGAYIFADDGNSATTQSSTISVTGPQGQTCTVSTFTLVGVATGTWKVTLITATSSRAVSNVQVTQNATTSIPNGTTSPLWPAANFYHTALRSEDIGGLATGFVFGAGTSYSTRLNGILVGASDGSLPVRTNSQGFYILNLTTGTMAITANYNSDNGNYTTSDAITTITDGAVTNMPDFHLPQGGYIKGFVTPGTGALPNIPVRATLNGATYEDTTDSTGYFYIFAATAAAAYTINPDLDPLQSFTAAASAGSGATVNGDGTLRYTLATPGITVQIGTFTVIGGMGTITGSVTLNGSPITTGVLIVASTASVPNPLAPIYAASAPAASIFYSASSQADGTYSLDVRGSSVTTYNLRAFYPVVDNSGGVTYTSKLFPTSFSVGAGAIVTNKDFTWP